jgi:hypothetical protein
MFPDVAVIVTFDVPAGGIAGIVPDGLLPDDPQPTIRLAVATKMTRTPRTRKLASDLRRRKASNDPNGSSSAVAIPNPCRLPFSLSAVRK